MKATESQKEKMRKYYDVHKEEIKKKNREYARLHPKDRREYSKIYRDTHRLELRKKVKIRTAELKEEIFAAYGNCCSCCGIADSVFLGIDHVNNNGSKERKQIGRGKYTFYFRLKKLGFPATYRILCHNCNLGRYLNGGICPHQKEK